MCANFSETCISVVNKLKDVYIRKNNDYGNSAHDTFEKYGVTAYAVRITDKLNRLTSLTSGNKQMVADESIRDTMEDTANYLIMLAADLDNVDAVSLYDALLKTAWAFPDSPGVVFGSVSTIVSWIKVNLENVVKSNNDFRSLAVISTATFIIKYIAYLTMEEMGDIK